MSLEFEQGGRKNTSSDRRSRVPSFSQNPGGLGKLPPQATDLEEAVLGALMLEKDALSSVIDILKPDVFYRDAHQKIFMAIHTLFEKSSPVDILTVTAQLRQQGDIEMVGGAYYITELTNRVASAANIEFHARIIVQKFIQRELIRISTEIINSAFEDTSDVFELLDMAEKNLFDLAQNNLRRETRAMGDIVRESLKNLEELRNKTDGLTGVPSGFTGLDRITSGWQRSDLIIIAARPGMGKTAFVVSCARNAAVQFKKGVAIFSLEMSSVQLVNRLLAGEAEISQEKIRRGDLAEWEWQKMINKIGSLSAAPLYIDDTPALNIFEFRAKCRRLKAQYNIDMVIVDYLQLMHGKGDNKGGNREQEIGSISRALKSVAKELDIPVIALAQLSRAVETRPGNSKRPQLSDLRESGSIEQDADQVLFLYRPEYYGFKEDDEDGSSTEGIGEVIIGKNRHGELTRVKLRFVKEFVKFADLDGDFGAPQSGGGFASPLLPSAEFDKPGGNGNIIIKGSRMNEMNDDDEQPF
ncbi:MAG: replicative DNA helicase [Mucilaginibacter polytrichastri]|nr:replicative DNA helicase [Mucilaginibacter polytrichastri]